MPLRFLTGGESHGPTLTAILDGVPAGLPLSASTLQSDLKRRQVGLGSGERMKLESDQVQIQGGVLEGKTTGAPIVLFIPNQDHNQWKNKPIKALTTPRPGHADLTGAVKYGYSDFRPSLERASARETAARVAVGSVCKQLLSQFGIIVRGYVSSIGDVFAHYEELSIEDRYLFAEQNNIRCPDPNSLEQMQSVVFNAIDRRDTLGGIIEVTATGLPIGLGSFVQWDRRLDALLGMAVMSIPAIKGVEIGPAFNNTQFFGTIVHDAIKLDIEKTVRSSNRSGGIEGGITNGEPLILRAAMKPIATTLTPQKTVDFSTQTETHTVYERSDTCPVPRAVPVVEAMVAFILAQSLIEKLGGDSLTEMRPRFQLLSKSTIHDLMISSDSKVFWQNE